MNFRYSFRIIRNLSVGSEIGLVKRMCAFFGSLYFPYHRHLQQATVMHVKTKGSQRTNIIY